MQDAFETAKSLDQKSSNPRRAHASPPASGAQHPVLALQQQAGNQAVHSMLRQAGIHPKLEISQPDDPGEREADMVADRIMRMQDSPPVPSPCSCAAGGEECEECKQKAQSSIQRQAHPSDAPAQGSQIVENALGSSGRPLEPDARAFFETRFGQDFSAVRIHTGLEAEASARSINADAYTSGSDVVFGSGQYSPQTTTGGTLLAHELAHVVQQRSSPASQHADNSSPRIRGGAQIQRQAVEPFTIERITPEHAAGLSDRDLDKNILEILTLIRGLRPIDPDYSALLENLTILLNERARRAPQQRMGGSLPQLLVDWSAAGLLAPPYRPPGVGEIPPLQLTQKQTQNLGPPPVAAGLAVPKLLPPEPVPPAPTSPPLRLVPPEPVPVEPVAPVEPVPVEPIAPIEPVAPVEPIPPGSPVIAAAPILAAAAILLWSSETAPAWEDEMSPVTDEPYSSPQEYDWTNRLTPEQLDFLRRLKPYRRVKPDPQVDEDPDPTIVPTPKPVPKSREKEKPKPCFSSEVPRRGGYPRHDAYATRVTGSVYDYYVRTPFGLAINYDGLRAPFLVWEVKVGHGWFFNPDYASLRDLTLAKWDAQKSVGVAVASACSYLHLWTIPDQWVAGVLNTRWGGVPPVLSIPER